MRIMKKVTTVFVAMIATVIVFTTVAWAQEIQLPKREMKGIKTLAEMYFPNKQVTFYKNRVFVRDNAGYVLTFKIVQRKVGKDEIDGRSGYEGIAALFLLSVSDYLQRPDRGPLGFGENVVVGKIGEINKAFSGEQKEEIKKAVQAAFSKSDLDMDTKDEFYGTLVKCIMSYPESSRRPREYLAIFIRVDGLVRMRFVSSWEVMKKGEQVEEKVQAIINRPAKYELKPNLIK